MIPLAGLPYPRSKLASTCHCGIPLFWDSDEQAWLCPGRFNGSHTEEKDREHKRKLLELQQTRAKAGSIGGNSRAATLTPAQRRDIAKRAANTRWRKS